MKDSSELFVLLADVVGSRRIEDRVRFDQKLQAGLQAASKTFQNAFELPLQVWKGLDEVAAVLKSPVELYRMISVIQDAVTPQKFRFVLVRGSIDLMPPNGDVRQADGPVFHQAAAAMQQLKRAGLLFSCASGNTLWDQAFSTQVNLMLLLKDDWTERQRLIYTAYTGSNRQEEVAAALQVSQQTVSKTLQAIRATAVQKLEAALETWTKRILDRMMHMCWISYIIIAAAFVLLVATSGRLISYVLQQVAHKPLEEVASEDAPQQVQQRLNIGAIIGKCENVLILAFLILEAYTAIAIVVTAKTIVRKEEIERNSMYFLAGTMINVSYSVLVGFILKLLLPLIRC